MTGIEQMDGYLMVEAEEDEEEALADQYIIEHGIDTDEIKNYIAKSKMLDKEPFINEHGIVQCMKKERLSDEDIVIPDCAVVVSAEKLMDLIMNCDRCRIYGGRNIGMVIQTQNEIWASDINDSVEIHPYSRSMLNILLDMQQIGMLKVNISKAGLSDTDRIKLLGHVMRGLLLTGTDEELERLDMFYADAVKNWVNGYIKKGISKLMTVEYTGRRHIENRIDILKIACRKLKDKGITASISDSKDDADAGIYRCMCIREPKSELDHIFLTACTQSEVFMGRFTKTYRSLISAMVLNYCDTYDCLFLDVKKRELHSDDGKVLKSINLAAHEGIKKEKIRVITDNNWNIYTKGGYTFEERGIEKETTFYRL